MSKLMIKGQQASGTYANASDIKINEISGMTASNTQEALVALNSSLTQLEKGHIYSKTTEKIVGYATNNKPIYELTLTPLTTDYDLTSLNISEVVSMQGMTIFPSGTSSALYYYESASMYSQPYISADKKTLKLHSVGISYLTVILQYLKTS